MTKEDIKKAAEEYAKEACRPLWRAGYEQVCMPISWKAQNGA